MKSFDFKQDLLPHILVIFSFIIITLTYFKPVLLEHKQIKQHDILEHLGSAQEIIEFREKHKEEPLWTNSMFGGMPAYLVSTIHKGEIIQKISNRLFTSLPHPVGILLINLISFYVLLLVFGVRPVYAAIGAFAFAFASYTLVSLVAGHNSKIKALGYAPLVLAGVVLVFKNRLGPGFILTALGLALNLGSGHMQITYYLAIILIIVGVVEFGFALRDKLFLGFFKKVCVLILAAIIGIAATLGSFLTTYEYSKFTMRGGRELKANEKSQTNSDGGLDKEYAFAYSNSLLETFSIIIPNIKGGASSGTLDRNSTFYKSLIRNGVLESQAQEYIQSLPLYWGQQRYTAGPTYFGAIICFLFVLGLLVVDKKTRIWLLVATLIAIVFSWGKNFSTLNYFVFDYLPGYNKFRSVTFIMIIAQICIPLGAILALNKVMEEKYSKTLFNKLLTAVGITAGLCILFGLFANAFNYSAPVDQQLASQGTWLVDALKEDRKGLLRGDAFRSFFLIVISGGLIWAAWKQKLSKITVGLIIGVLVLLDIWFVDKRYVNDKNFERNVVKQHFEPTQADKFILQDKSNYRVFNLINPWEEAKTSYYHKSIGGYSGGKMQRYQDLIERHLSIEHSGLIQNLQKGQLDFSKLNVLNMLNTKYFVFGEGQKEVLKNSSALGNAWFVEKIKKVNSPDEEINSLNSIDPQKIAVVDASKFNLNETSFPADSSAFIHLVNYKSNHLIYKVNTNAPGFAMFSEIYYPKGWKAFINGKETQIYRVNYILRGLEMPAGKHTIEFKFSPNSYVLGNTIALISSIIIMISSILVIIWNLKVKLSKR